MKKILYAKVSAWYAGAVTVSVECLTSVFSCRAIMEGATDGWRVIAKAAMLSTCVTTGLLLGAFSIDAMRNKKYALPYFLAMFLVGVIMFLVKFFYVV